MGQSTERNGVFERRVAVLVAVTAVVAGVAGALAGGFASYLGNRALEDARSRDAARGQPDC